jgi:hypothetical protein
MENLIFRRQFILCSRNLTLEASWKVTKLGKFHKDCYLNSHPDLVITSSHNEQVELFLLGFAIDPFHPELSNQDILENLLKSSSFDELTVNANPLGGRFAIIYNTKDLLYVFNDATGFREVFYYKDQQDFACGSTPNIIAKYFSVERDNDKEKNDFFNSPELNNRERYWIGDQTIFKGILRLFPNHYLDLIQNQSIRFWPKKERKIIDLKEATEYFAKILDGTYACATNRYELHHSITSGWDSRFLMSAALKYANKMKFYFYRGIKKTDIGKGNVDYLVSKEISDYYNLSADYVYVKDVEVDKEFERIFYSNNVRARPKLLKAFYDTYVKKLDNTVTVSGTSGNEILRVMNSFHRNTDDVHVIAKMLGYDKYPYVIKSISKWMDSTRYLKEKNYVLIDLFFWEQYFSNWGGLGGSEQDIVREELRPFNNRELISTFLAMHDKNRYRDYPLGYVKTIKLLRPELLKFGMDMNLGKVKGVLRKLGLEQAADKLFHLIKPKREF